MADHPGQPHPPQPPSFSASSSSHQHHHKPRNIHRYGTFVLRGLETEGGAHDDEAAALLALEEAANSTWSLTRIKHQAAYCMGELMIKSSAIFIAVFITIVDNLPYGLLIFPPEANLGPLGVQIVLISAVVSQFVYGAMSDFPCALGSMIIENVAFLRTMATSLFTQLHDQKRTREALMTILFSFSLSTILTGAAFYGLGVLELGKISSFLPQHVLLGVISGMGTFILFAGMGISTGIDWSWEPRVLWQQVHPAPLLKLIVAGLLTIGLSAIKIKISHPIVTPVYFLMIPLIFYGILSVFHIPMQAAQESGWLFSFAAPPPCTSGEEDGPMPMSNVTGNSTDTTSTSTSSNSTTTTLLFQTFLHHLFAASPSTPSPTSPYYSSSFGVPEECRSFPGVLACLDPRLIAWDLIPTQLFTILGLIFFSLIHAPVNVPALAATTGIEADLNRELKAHGVSNALSGLVGGLQNYMAYSTSALYFKTGGDGKVCSFIVAGLLGGFLLLGPEAINYFPRPLAGCLLLHLGAVLLYESLVETWRKAVDVGEYVTIWTICLSMTIIGFMEGVGIGLLLACGIFVMQCSRVNPIGSCFTGDGLSSKEIRSVAQRKLLDYRLQGSIYIIRLRGNLFFGNVEQLGLHVREVLLRMPRLMFLVLDTGEMVGIDFSARERLARICKNVTSQRVHMLWASLNKPLKQKLQAGKCFDPPTTSTHNLPSRPSGQGLTTAAAARAAALRGGGGMTNTRLHHFAKDLNRAFTFCEDAVLTTLGAQDKDESADMSSTGGGGGGGGTNTMQSGGNINTNTPTPTPTTMPPPSSSATTNNNFLNRTLQKLAGATTDTDTQLVARLVPYFTREVLPAGMTLWRRNDPSSFACIVQTGMLGVPRQEDDPSVSASLAQAPASVGRSGYGHGWPPPYFAGMGGSFLTPRVVVDDEDGEEEEEERGNNGPFSVQSSRRRGSSRGRGERRASDFLTMSATIGGGPGDFVEYSLPGQMSGELGLFNKELRKYDMRAVVETVLWRIDAVTLARMREQDPQAYIVLQRIALSYASHRLHCLMLQGQLHSV